MCDSRSISLMGYTVLNCLLWTLQNALAHKLIFVLFKLTYLVFLLIFDSISPSGI